MERGYKPIDLLFPTPAMPFATATLATFTRLTELTRLRQHGIEPDDLPLFLRDLSAILKG